MLEEEFRQKEGKLNTVDRELYGSILHNMGSCFARMFFYDAAAGFFWQAYEVSGNQKEQKYVLLCQKLLLSDEEYREYLSEHIESACHADEVEQMAKQAEEKWHKTGNYIEMARVMRGEEFENIEEFWIKQKAMVDGWKRQYDTHVLY